MDSVVQIAMIVATGSAFSAVIAPIVQSSILYRQRRRERLEDYERQDRIAAKVDQVADTAASNAISTNNQLKQIHTLVNSDMTAARQSELEQTRVSLALMRKLVAQDIAAGADISIEDRATIESTEARIKELEQILADRLVQLRIVEAEALQGTARNSP